MHIAYFTERPYRWIDEDLVLENRAFFGLSNKYLDRRIAADGYRDYHDEYRLAEELGFDGVALNEHHGTPYCMGSVMNLEAAVMARITESARIILIGNPLPALRHPLRTAEELATIDLISRGRLVSGMLRGSGSESFFNNVNPAYNREVFEEAHDFIVQAWTRPGPWRYEGKHFHYRHVNPWVLPYQQPHPPIVVPGVLSPETIVWAAERNYPYVGLGTTLKATTDMWDIYADRAADLGYQAGSENFGFVLSTLVADTDERAQELGANFMYGGGQAAYSAPQYTLPPGYNSRAATARLAATPGGTWLGVSQEKLLENVNGGPRTPVDKVKARAKQHADYQRAQDNYQLVIGSPDTVTEKLKTMLRVMRPGMFVFFGPQGRVETADRRRNIELLAKHVIPELRSYAKELGLVSPFDKAPGSTRLAQGATRTPVVDREPLHELTGASDSKAWR